MSGALSPLRPLPKRTIDLAPDPWCAVDARTGDRFEAAIARMGIEHLVHRGAPRDIELAKAHLVRHLPAGRLLVHGAGSHSRQILPTLESIPGVDVVGVIDKLAGIFDEFEGHAVITPAEAASRIQSGEAQHVLLSNTIWEMSMRSCLIAAGIPTERILSIYSDPRYVEASLRAHAARIAALPASGSEFALVDFERQGQQVIDDQTLSGVLPTDRTLRLHSQRFDLLSDDSIFESHGFLDSILLLRAMLQRLRPRAIYLRTFIEDNLTASLLRRFVPEAKLIHEPYDWGLTIEPSFLRTVHGHDDRSIQMVLTGELHTARTADFVISKRGGPAWRRVGTELSAPNASFFPQLEGVGEPQAAPERLDPGTDKRLVYAGNLPAPHTLDHDMVGTLFPLYEELTASPGIHISVFNGMHRSSELDATFAPYSDKANARLEYHGAIPYPQLVAELPNHDYGWLYFPRDGIDFPDERVLISNKFTGYICAGLPVLIDDGWEYMASLVEDFQAGIVLPMRAPERVRAALEEADVEAHRRGARALRKFMVESNARALERLREVLSCPGDAPGRKTPGPLPTRRATAPRALRNR